VNLNFKQKIVLPVLVLIVLGLAGSGFISNSKSKSALQNAISSQINGTTASTLSVMDSWVEDRKRDVVTWSTLEICQTAMKETFLGKAARKKSQWNVY